MSETSTGIMDRLREGTKSLHDSAEAHGFQQALFAGKLSREAYANYLGQMLHLYRALESCIQEAQNREPRIAAVVKEHNYRTEDLRADLAHLGAGESQFEALPATRAVMTEIERITAEQPIALLGMHYVLEGSNNGNHFIAKNIRKAYEFEQDGARFLDPYGEQQRPRWAEYKTAMAELKLSEEESELLVNAAQEMFRAIGRVSQELHESAPVATL